uniref:Uncharacterized protein n=1 Tax=Riboviria sp. TaxID=2585031 RepID=A0A514D0C3_9VIRU|nr:MAG: hypothetical protein H1Rhizo26FD1135_000001 [Riboviria sp.]
MLPKLQPVFGEYTWLLRNRFKPDVWTLFRLRFGHPAVGEPTTHGDGPPQLPKSVEPSASTQRPLSSSFPSSSQIQIASESNSDVFDIPVTPTVEVPTVQFERRLEVSGVVFSHGVISVPKNCKVLISRKPHTNALVYLRTSSKDKFIAEIAGDAPFELVGQDQLPKIKTDYVLTDGKFVHTGPMGYYELEEDDNIL